MFEMKVRVRRWLFWSLALFAMLIAAQAATPQDGSLQALVEYFGTLAGFAAIIAFSVNLGKRAGWIKDGNAAQVVQWLNFAGLVVVGVLYFVAPDSIPFVDNTLKLLAELGGAVLPILALIFGWPVANFISGKVHNNIRGFPLLGYSHSQ